MNNLPQKPYRLEERRNDGFTNPAAFVETSSGVPFTRETGWEKFKREVAADPERYAPDSTYRLVLLGPDRTTLPAVKP